MIRLVLADDQPIVRAGVARILGPADGFEVVAECGDGSEVVDAVRRTGAELVVMDVRMPCVDGLEATRRLRAEPEPPPILVLTTFSDDDVLWGAIEAGAAGFVLKDSTARNLIAAARAVAGGAAWPIRPLLPAFSASTVPSSRPRSGTPGCWRGSRIGSGKCSGGWPAVRPTARSRRRCTSARAP